MDAQTNLDVMEGAYRVEVRHRATGSLVFRWEIYRPGEAKPVATSFNVFRSADQALGAGERALAKLQAERVPAFAGR